MSRTPSRRSTCSKRCARTAASELRFSSTGSIYGEPEIFPTPEDAPFPMQTSLYGASKLAAEGMIQAYCEGFGFQGYIFRFVSILGERYTHGHVFDFYKKLSDDPTRLHVLGDGKQRKSYLYVHDCIDAMLLAIRVLNNKVHVLNLGTDEASRVNDSIGWISERLGVRPELTYSGRRARLDRRQPVHPARYTTHSRARMEAEADHPRGRAAHGRLARAKSLGVRAAHMKLAVFGLWHLGTVTAACTAAAGIPTVAIDLDRERIARLAAGEPPLYEPGLAELIRSGLASGTLAFSFDVDRCLGRGRRLGLPRYARRRGRPRGCRCCASADRNAVPAFEGPRGRARVSAASCRLGRRAGAGIRTSGRRPHRLLRLLAGKSAAWPGDRGVPQSRTDRRRHPR